MKNKYSIAILYSAVFLCGSSHAKLNTYLEGSNLVTSFSAIADIPPFLKQGDLLSIRTLTPPGSGALYTATLNWTPGDTGCSFPSSKPKKYELYNWPTFIEMGNMRLDLVDSESMGIETGKAPRICADYQIGGSATGTRSDREFVGNGMKKTYRVSQIYQAGSDSKAVSIYVTSGRSEYSEGEIISKLKNYLYIFRPVSINITTSVKSWCSASVGPGKDIQLSHGVITPADISGNTVTSAMQLSCQGEGANFKLKWLDGNSADNPKDIDLKNGISSKLVINGLSSGGNIYIPKDSTTSINISSILRINGRLIPGKFKASQVLLIDIQ